MWKNVNPCINSEYQDRALFMFNITGTGASFSYVIEDPGVYYLVLTTCSSTINPVEITSETTLMNPGAAKYLSADVKKINNNNNNKYTHKK